MDLALAVRRLSQLLGPEASPDLVEHVLTAVLDSGPLPEDQSAPETRLWIVAAAPSGVPLLMDMLAALTAFGAAVYDVVQHATPAGTLLTLEAAADDAGALRARLDEVATRHGATVSVLRPSIAAALLEG